MSPVPYVLVDADGVELARPSFGVEARPWLVGEVVVLGAGARYRVLERREPEAGGEPVTLVVEPE